MLGRSRFLPRLALALPLAAALAVAVLPPPASASIERLTLRQMVEKTDGAIYGRIVGKQVSAVPVYDGAEELYFTTLTIEGRSLYSDEELTVSVSYPGGFVDEERGAWNSEAPSEDDVKIGNRVVAFWKWSDNMGGGFASNALYAAHGGIFRTFESRKNGRVVLGRGPGYAVPGNRKLAEVEVDVRANRREFERGR